MDRVRVMLVDDHAVFSAAVSVVLGAEPDIEVVGTASTGAAAMTTARLHRPDVALVDVDLADASGLDLVAPLRDAVPGLRVIAVTCHDDGPTAYAAVRAGASGFVPKGAACDDLVRAVRGVHAGQSWVPPDLLTHVLAAYEADPRRESKEAEAVRGLTERELSVLGLMVAGCDRAAIAERLFLSTNTVRTHTQNVLTKLGVHSRVEAVGIALRAGLRPETADH